MRPSWRDGLVDAFPVPEDRRKTAVWEEGIEDNIAVAADEMVPETPSLTTPFPFFRLPAELRNRIYLLVLRSPAEDRRADGRRKGSRISMLLASKRFHHEASYVFYSSLNFRVFPLQEFVPVPLVQELPPHYRSLVTNLEMVVGSSWTAPPKTWKVTRSLAKCLRKLEAVQALRVFVELDPSHPMFAKYRISFDFYTNFCGNLLRDVLAAMPQLQFVELDGNPGVAVNGPLVSRLRAEAEAQGQSVRWAKEGVWVRQV